MPMKVFSASTGAAWLKKIDPAPAANGQEPKPDPAEQEVRRVLSDVFRCNNLVVLAGLGSSLCLRKSEDGSALAPTMPVLWNRVLETHELVGTRSWSELLALVHSPLQYRFAGFQLPDNSQFLSQRIVFDR